MWMSIQYEEKSGCVVRVVGPFAEQAQADEYGANSGAVWTTHEVEAPLSPNARILQMIRDARDHHAEHGEYPEFPNGPGEDQCFDDWAADLADAALTVGVQ